MDIFHELDLMQRRIIDGDWPQFEKHYAKACSSDAPNLATKIEAVDLGSYHSDRLFGSYCKALKKANKSSASAIYYEYDMDNDWDTNFFVCPEYAPREAGDDDWACEYNGVVRAPGIYDFGKIYSSLGGFCTDQTGTSAILYMIARTVVSLKEILDRKPSTKVVCMAFHDQDPVHRLFEPGG
jgi:hypothetical protein